MSLAWGGLSNGNIPANRMVQIGVSVYGLGTQYAQHDAARTFAQLNNALHAARGRRLTIGEGYRNYARQVKLRNDFTAGRGPVAAIPGTSNHGWGRAIDIAGYNSGDLLWLEANAARYGWSWKTGQASGEAWHYEYVGPIASRQTRTAKGKAVTLYHTRHSDGKFIWALAGDSPGTPANWRETRSQTLANEIAGQTGPSAELSPETWANWKADYLEPLATSGGGGSVDVSALQASIDRVREDVNRTRTVS